MRKLWENIRFSKDSLKIRKKLTRRVIVKEDRENFEVGDLVTPMLTVIMPIKKKFYNYGIGKTLIVVLSDKETPETISILWDRLKYLRKWKKGLKIIPQYANERPKKVEEDFSVWKIALNCKHNYQEEEILRAIKKITKGLFISEDSHVTISPETMGEILSNSAVAALKFIKVEEPKDKKNKRTTVKELIEKLKAYPEGYEVHYQTRDRNDAVEENIELAFFNDSNISNRLTLEFIKFGGK